MTFPTLTFPTNNPPCLYAFHRAREADLSYELAETELKIATLERTMIKGMSLRKIFDSRHRFEDGIWKQSLKVEWYNFLQCYNPRATPHQLERISLVNICLAALPENTLETLPLKINQNMPISEKLDTLILKIYICHLTLLEDQKNSQWGRLELLKKCVKFAPCNTMYPSKEVTLYKICVAALPCRADLTRIPADLRPEIEALRNWDCSVMVHPSKVEWIFSRVPSPDNTEAIRRVIISHQSHIFTNFGRLEPCGSWLRIETHIGEKKHILSNKEKVESESHFNAIIEKHKTSFRTLKTENPSLVFLDLFLL